MAGLGSRQPWIRCAAVGVAIALVATGCEEWTTAHPSDLSSLEVPSDWAVSTGSTGQIDVVSPPDKGDRITMLPFFTAEALTAPRAQATLTTVTGGLVRGVQWGEPSSPAEGTWRMSGTADGQDLVAILTYATSPTGSAGTVFVAIVPSGRFAQDGAVLARIMGSLKLAGAASDAARPAIAYVSWPPADDARLVAQTQGAFSVEVPANLGVSGGMLLAGSVTQWWVEVHNAVEDLGVQMGNRGFPIYMKPNVFYPNDPRPARPYLPGARFVTDAFGPETLRNFAVRNVTNLPNLAALEPVIPGFNRIDAGLVDFTFTKNGVPLHGGALAITEEFISGAPQLWDVRAVVFWFGSEATFDTATEVMAHMWSSFRANPDWVTRYQQTVFAQSTVWSQSARQVSAIIAGTFGNIDTAANELRRRRANAILGTVDVTAADGRRFKVDNSPSHYWLTNDGTIFGTTTSVPPCQNCQELLVQK